MCLLWSTNWGFISQKSAFFIVTAVKTSNLALNCPDTRRGRTKTFLPNGTVVAIYVRVSHDDVHAYDAMCSCYLHCDSDPGVRPCYCSLAFERSVLYGTLPTIADWYRGDYSSGATFNEHFRDSGPHLCRHRTDKQTLSNRGRCEGTSLTL
jgi:hypothetical protein